MSKKWKVSDLNIIILEKKYKLLLICNKLNFQKFVYNSYYRSLILIIFQIQKNIYFIYNGHSNYN